MSEHAISPATTTTTVVMNGLEDLSTLDEIPSLNLVAMPALGALCGNAYNEAVGAIASYCASRRAFFIVDPPSDWTSVDAVARGVGEVASIVGENGAIYWPPLTGGPASRAIAAIYVATDDTRGVWKAPAGVEAVIPDAEPLYKLTDADNGVLNPLGVNCIRGFPVYGTLVWGARTLAGADVLASDWKYVNVRRLALFVESSIIEGMDWTATEPNAQPLWTEIRRSVENFLTSYWRAGAFAGATPAEAFFVQCDSTTMTQDDIDNGRLNVMVGFAAVKPAEFIVLRIGLWARKPEDDDVTATPPIPPPP